MNAVATEPIADVLRGSETVRVLVTGGAGLAGRHLVRELAGVTPEVRADPKRFRRTNTSPILDTSLIRTHTGWQAEIPLSQTLKDMLGVNT